MKHKLIFFASILFITFCGARTTFSQWERMNIRSGAAPFVGIGTNTSSPIIFAGNYAAGVIRSTDNGRSWTSPSSDLINLAVDALAAIGANSSAPILLAGTYDHGLFRSTDSGTSWIESDSGMPKNVIIADFGIAGSQASPMIFVSTAYGSAGGVFLSTDNGTHWHSVNSGLTMLSIGPLAVASSNASTPLMFAMGTASGVFLTTNNGSSWTSESNGIPSGSLLSLAVLDTNTPSPIVFTGTWGAGVFRSMDEGTNWEKENNGLTDLTIYSLATYGMNLFAGTDSGIFLSTDSGTSWRSVSEGLSPNTLFGYIGVVGSTLFAQSDSVVDMFGDDTAFAWRRPLSEMLGPQGAVVEPQSVSSEFQIYPNPASATLRCQAGGIGEAPAMVTILDLLGRTVMSIAIANASDFSLDTRQLPDGVYTMTVRSEGHSAQGQFVVAK